MQNGRIRIIARQSNLRHPGRAYGGQRPPTFPPGLVPPQPLAGAMIASCKAPAKAPARQQAKVRASRSGKAPESAGVVADDSATAVLPPAARTGDKPDAIKSAKRRAIIAKRRKQHSTSRKGTAPARRAARPPSGADSAANVLQPVAATMTVDHDAFMLAALTAPTPIDPPETRDIGPTASTFAAAKPALPLPALSEPLLAADPPRIKPVREITPQVPRNTSLAAPPRGLIAAIAAWLQSASRLASFGLLRQKRRPLPRALQRVPSRTSPTANRAADSTELARLRAENRRLRSQIELIALNNADRRVETKAPEPATVDGA